MGGDEVGGLADRQDPRRFVIGDADAVAVLELHHQLHEVERVRLEILLEAGALGDAGRLHLELGGEVLADAFEDLVAGHLEPTLAVGADLNAPASARACAVRSTMRSSTARRARATAFAIPLGPKLPCATTTGLRSPSRIAPPTPSGSSSSLRRSTLPLIRRPPTLDIGPDRMASRMEFLIVFEVASSTFRATLPVKPSVTITSTVAAGRSKPSTLPTKLSGPPASRSPARSTSGVPLPCSSPTDSSPTRGRSSPYAASMKQVPMYANCSRCSGLTSTLAPQSRRRTGPPGMGSSTARAGRYTPRRRLIARVDAASVGPVLPAETSASAWPSPTALAAW